MKPEILLVEPMMPAIEQALDAAYTVHRLSAAADRDRLIAEVADRVRAVVTGGGTGVKKAVVEALPNGLTADARAFIGQPPSSLSSCEIERAGFREAFFGVKADLVAAFEESRPSDESYSPLCFFFNFSHNVLKGVVVDALLTDTPCELSFDDLLTGIPRGRPISKRKIQVAQILMGYARANPHRIRGRLRPVIVYDVQTGREAYSVAWRKLND